MTWHVPADAFLTWGHVAIPIDMTDVQLFVGVRGEEDGRRVDAHTFWMVADLGVMELKLEKALDGVRAARRVAV